ncbi:MAG: 4-(cytidine 5'-diphospho)-2-C-methyl-D-erythritol kinase [Spirochaetales bacterium]|uniref:4-diphosphocytidyl-2-C-methyl-D-erythritol kinase n=1 Tax=Candidatus Thalassospirochaeta sargassi TaxID=3119039 RepID=A0AAJ1MJ55_9SPIO|nr:4-(cytidine 5'-diphospho)-2-C-methyl-D-erythritol kinase [Spirochaetales bacterium]
MQKRCILKAPAKLNLHLQIGGKRADGFHDINSLFIMVDLFDEFDASSLKTGNDCRIIGDFNCKTEQNLIYKAWQLFCLEAGSKYGIEFRVRKNIPSFAGLGGGSSDAAAALKIMNNIFDVGFSDDQLIEIGCRLGSDVPFFLTSPAALISGRGEDVKEIDTEELHFVVVQPDVEISTAEAYGWIDSSEISRKPFLTQGEIIDIFRGPAGGYTAYSNDFEDELNARFDEFLKAESLLYNEGALYSTVTGSGSAVLGLFESPEKAEKAKNSLQNSYKFVQKIKSLDRIPYAILE